MNQRFSRWLRLTPLLLLTLLVFAGCEKGCAKKVAEDEVFRFIPADHNVLLGMNWQKVKASPLAEKIMKDIPPSMKPVLEEINGVVIAMKIEEVNQEGRKFIGVTKGKSNPEKVVAGISKIAEEKGTKLTMEDYQGYKVYSSPLDGNFVLGVVGNQILFGSKEKVQNAIDVSNHKADAILKSQGMMKQLQTVDQNKMIWAVALIPEKPEAEADKGAAARGLSSIKAIDFMLDFDKVFLADLGVLAKSKEDAQQMTAMANSYRALFGSSLGKQNPAVGKLLESLKIENAEDRVKLSIQVDQETLEMISKKIQEKEKSMVGSKVSPESIPSNP